MHRVPAVVLPLVTAHTVLLGRTLLYTAVTRARQLMVLVGQQRALELTIRDWRRAPRQTALAGLLSGSIEYAWLRAGAGGGQRDTEVWEGLVGDEAGG